jgi:hypothetical protein
VSLSRRNRATDPFRAIADTESAGRERVGLSRDNPKDAADRDPRWPCRGLTFDMSDGPKGAKRPLARPLDGEARRHAQRVQGLRRARTGSP